jgi:hypothetical protein
MTYNQEKTFLLNVEKDNPQNKRELFNEKKIKELLVKYPTLPDVFLDYLREIGAGSFREGQFNVYGWLGTLDTFGLAEVYDIQDNIIFFGDNYSGDFSGFNLSNNACVVEFWHETGEIFETELTFNQYIRQQMLMDENGNDLRVK